VTTTSAADKASPLAYAVYTWPLDREFLVRRRGVLHRVVRVLQQRALRQSQDLPLLTQWPGSSATQIDFEDYERWIAFCERSPMTNLAAATRAEKPQRAAVKDETQQEAKRAREELSRVRNEAQDQVRITLAVASVCGYASLATDERLHIALDIHDGVTPWTMRDGTVKLWTVQGQQVPMLKRAEDLAPEERDGVRFLASLLGHFATNEILTRATNYLRSRDYVVRNGLSESEKAAWLRQAPLIGLSTASPVPAEVAHRYSQLWLRRVKAAHRRSHIPPPIATTAAFRPTPRPSCPPTRDLLLS
jgi:hypothetical protein